MQYDLKYFKINKHLLNFDKRQIKEHHDIWSLHSQKHHGLTERRPIIDQPKVNNQSLGPSTAPFWCHSTHFESKEDFSAGYSNISYCQNYTHPDNHIPPYSSLLFSDLLCISPLIGNKTYFLTVEKLKWAPTAAAAALIFEVLKPGLPTGLSVPATKQHGDTKY